MEGAAQQLPVHISPYPFLVTSRLLLCSACLLRIPTRRECFSLINCTFHRVSGSVSSQRHMLVSKTNEHVRPNVVETFFSFSSLAVAHRSLSPVCFPNISHKSDLSRTLNGKLPMFHPERFQRRPKLVLLWLGLERVLLGGTLCKLLVTW